MRFQHLILNTQLDLHRKQLKKKESASFATKNGQSNLISLIKEGLVKESSAQKLISSMEMNLVDSDSN